MSVGWIAVQVLLVLLHVRQMEDPETLAAGRVAVRLDRAFAKDVDLWRILFFCLHLPLFGYPAYLAAGWSWFPGETNWARLGRNLLSLAGLIVSFISVVWTVSWGAAGSYVWLRDRRLSRTYPAIRTTWYTALGVVPLWSWWTAASASHYLQMTGFLDRNTAAWPGSRDKPSLDLVYTFTSFFEPGTFLYYVVDEAFEFTCRVLLFMGILLELAFFYLAILWPELIGLDVKKKDVAGTRISVGSLMLKLVVFLAYLVCYDSGGTHKASWTEVLG